MSLFDDTELQAASAEAARPKRRRYGMKSIEALARQLHWTVRRIGPQTLMLVRNGRMMVMVVMPRDDHGWVAPDTLAWLEAIREVEGCDALVVRPATWRSGHIHDGLVNG